MKNQSIKLLSIACLAFVLLMACTGNNEANQQQTTVHAVQQPAQVLVDSTQPQAQTQIPAASPQAVPEAINAFVQQYFAGATIAYVETDSEHGGIEYDVTLNDGTEIDFDLNNQWDNVDCHTKAIPAALVPQAIANYVKTNYQALPITKIDKDAYGYEIELSNGMDLKFDTSGRFLGIDD